MRRRLPGLLLLLSACSLSPRASSPFALEALTFGGPGFRAVELDGYGTARGPHWPLRSQPPLVAEDVPEHYRLHGPPVAYLGGTRPEAELVARVPESWQGTVQVRGERFTGVGTAAAGVLRARVLASEALPHGSASIPRWRIRWEATHQGTRAHLGTSEAALYVLAAEPRGPLTHSALALVPDGTADVVAAVWQHFARREVRRARDGRPLRYYGEFRDGAPAELRRMLVSGTGQCVAWAYLLQAAVAAHGVEAEIVGVYPPERGRLFIKPWRFLEGTVFVEAGANGVVETDAAGDDVAFIERGRGVPHARIWTPEPLPIGRLGGDDTLAYMVGRNGLAESFIDTTFALPLLARGFGLEMQRAYELEEGARITPGGDDVIVRHLESYYLLTGANGVLETGRQPGMKPGRARGSQWDPVVGSGATSIRVQAALPRGWHVDERAGDDFERDWLHTTGANGVSETRGALQGRGLAHAAAIGAGPNGRIDSTPGGDDRIVDLAEYLALAPAGYAYVSAFNMWPEPGARAQQNDWPPPDYPNHVLVKIAGQYYDPSYGTGPYASELEWERAQLAGVGVRITRGEEVVRVDERIIFVVRRPDGQTQLTQFIRMLGVD